MEEGEERGGEGGGRREGVTVEREREKRHLICVLVERERIDSIYVHPINELNPLIYPLMREC